MLTIGKLAKAAKVGVETIRFYEREGLIEQPQRPKDGFRTYPVTTLERIQFIKRAQRLGFTLKEISHLFDLSDCSCEEMRNLALDKLDLVRVKISDLQRLESALDGLVNSCEQNQDPDCCPIIDSLLGKDQ